MHGDDQRKGGIQTARQTDDRGLGAGMAQTGCQTDRLQMQNLLAARSQIALVGGYEGCLGKDTGQLGLAQGQIEVNVGHVGLRLTEGVHAAALVGDASEVKLGRNQTGGEALGLGQHGAILADEVMTGKDQILRGLAQTGIGVQVAAGQTCRLTGHQLTAVRRLADELVGGRQVDDNGRTRLCQLAGRRCGNPEVFADLAADDQTGHGAAAEQQIDSKGYLLTAQGDRAGHHASARGEVTRLVEFAVIGNVLLGHEAEQLAAAADRGAVIECVVCLNGQTDGNDHRRACRVLEDTGQTVLGGAQQGFLQEQVAAGVAGQYQLRENAQRDTGVHGFSHELDDAGGIISTVGDADARGSGGDLQKTIFHVVPPSD